MPGPNSDPKPHGKSKMKRLGLRNPPYRGRERSAPVPERDAQRQQGDGQK